MTATTKRALLIALQVLVLAAFALAIEHWWGFARLLAPWSQVPLELVAVVVVAQLISYSLRALRIYLAEPRIPRGAWGQCLQLILLNNALNLMLPARTGEASFPILMRRWFGVPMAEGAGTLLWLRLLDLNVLGVLALLTFAPALLPLPFAVWLMLALTAAVIPLLAPVLNRQLSQRLSTHEGKAAKLLQMVLAGIPQRPAQVLLDLGLSWSAWGIKLAALAAVFAALAQLSLVAGLLGAIGGDLSTVLPIHTPGGFGTYEAGVIAFASPLAPPTPALLAAAVNLHILVLGIALAAGALAWLTQPRMRKSAL
ncbi:MAG: lysylphosphatidylglycerol synthase domain-containing protein [Pseudomonadota bacterium]